MTNILILGGTTEASLLAAALAERQIAATLSYAGRTSHPRAQPVPVRVGGFGGVEGLARYLREQRITHLIDATHPFAAQMSANAITAARVAGVPLVALTRPAWTANESDRWTHVADMAGAVAALGGPARSILLALGRMHIDMFAAQPQHRYLLRFVDEPAQAPALLRYDLVIDRGPFTVEGDRALMDQHGIELVVAKNAGGTGAIAKLEAARLLGIPVLLIDRPALPARTELHDVAAVLGWLDHEAVRGV